MKLNFLWSDDGAYHQYCMNCHAETVSRIFDEGKTFYDCSTCKQRSDRSIVIDPAIEWWMDVDGEYWHESAGVFVSDNEGKFLFFERNIFPFALTVPSGHVDKGEKAEVSAGRELEEEVGISGLELAPLADDKIIGDSCRRGSDAHLWHAYTARIDKAVTIHVAEEGANPVWLTLEEAKHKQLTYTVEYIIMHYQDELARRSI